MSHSRRAFIELATSVSTAFAAISTGGVRPAQSSPGPRHVSALDAAILGEASALEHRQHSALRAHWAQIAAQAVLMERGGLSLEAAVQNIKKGVRDGFTDFPGVFAEVSRFLEPQPGDPVPIVRTTSLGLVGALGAYAAYATPPTAAAATATGALLTILGWQADQFGDRADKAIAQTMVTPPTDWEIFELTSWASAAYYRSLSTDEKMRLATELFESGQFSLDPRRKVEDAERLLPETTRDMIKACRVPAAAGTTIRRSVHDAVAKVSKRVTDTPFGPSPQQAYADAQFTLRELAGLGTIGAHIVGGSFGANAGRVIKTYTTGLTVAFNAMRNFTGTLDLIGTLVDVASSILNLGFDNKDPLMEALRSIGERIDELSTRLDTIEENQRTLLKDVAKIYSAIQTSQVHLNALRDQVANLALGNSQQLKALSRQPFVATRDELAAFVMNKRSSTLIANPSDETYFAARLTNCFSYATSTARDDNHTVQSVQLATWAAEAQRALSRSTADQRIGLLPLIAFRLNTLGAKAGGTTVELPNSSAVGNVTPVNPVSWAEGVYAYVRSAAAFDTIRAQESAHTSRLWSEGLYIRQTIQALTVPEVLTAIKRQLLRTAGNMPEQIDGAFLDGYRVRVPQANQTVAFTLYSDLAAWDTQNVPRSLSMPLWVAATSRGQIAYSLNASPYQHIVVKAVPDFLQILIDSKVVALNDMTPSYQKRMVVVADGPWKDYELGVFQGSATSRAYPGAGPLFDPVGLQQKAMDLAHRVLYRDKARAEMPAVVRKTFSMMKSEQTAQEFMFWLAAADTLAAFVRLRATEHTGDAAVAIADNDYGFSMESLANRVARRVGTSLSGAGDWPAQAVGWLHAELTSACDDLVSKASSLPEGRSGPLVESALRELAGFMFLRKVPRAA
jgi:hypothetical protein